MESRWVCLKRSWLDAMNPRRPPYALDRILGVFDEKRVVINCEISISTASLVVVVSPPEAFKLGVVAANQNHSNLCRCASETSFTALVNCDSAERKMARRHSHIHALLPRLAFQQMMCAMALEITDHLAPLTVAFSCSLGELQNAGNILREREQYDISKTNEDLG